jgi:hypothetical protein
MIGIRERVHRPNSKASLRRVFHRGIAAIVAVVFGLQASGCSTFPEHAETHSEESFEVRITAVSPGGNSTVSVPAQANGYVIVAAMPTWSSGEGAPEPLSFRVEKGKDYLVFAHEEGRGLVPVSVRESEGSGGGGMEALGAGMNGPGAGAVILIALLIYGVGTLLERKYAAKPSAGCCFVWLEDAGSGKVLAGLSPKDVKR